MLIMRFPVAVCKFDGTPFAIDGDLRQGVKVAVVLCGVID